MKFSMKKLFRRSKKTAPAQTTQFNYDRDPQYPSNSPPRQHKPTFSRNQSEYSNGYRDGSYGRNQVFAPWLELPTPILQRVFAFVCPHAKDESYETCEQSAIEDACMLCDLRDLAHSGMVCKSWRKAAQPVM